MQIGWQYLYVAVVIDPLTGRLWWAWAAVPGIDGRVWDGAGGHRGKAMPAVDAPRVVQPP